MGSPITFSGFNSIDFNVVLNAIMQQESRPLLALEAREKAIQATDTALTTLASKLDAIRTAAAALTNTSAAVVYSAASSNPGVANVTAGTTSVPGSYDVVVTQLARAQVTASASTAPDSDTTIVADAMARRRLHQGGADFYLAPTADDRDVWAAAMRGFAFEAGAFLLSPVQYVRRADYPEDFPLADELAGCSDVLLNGGSLIADPWGNLLAGPVYGREEILLADCDLGAVLAARRVLDTAGHYDRPDLEEAPA